MQANGSKRIAKLTTLKKVFWWTLGTVAAVPVTKWVESQLSLSIFSPAISELWNLILGIGGWFGQTAPMPLWALLAMTVCALLMATAFIWVVIDANGQLKAAYADLDAANSKIADLLNPHIATLSEHQQIVLSAIALDDNSGEGSYISSLPEISGLQRFVAEGALDVLLKNNMVEIYSSSFGARVGLAAAGREYILHPKSPVQWLVEGGAPQMA